MMSEGSGSNPSSLLLISRCNASFCSALVINCGMHSASFAVFGFAMFDDYIKTLRKIPHCTR